MAAFSVPLSRKYRLGTDLPVRVMPRLGGKSQEGPTSSVEPGSSRSTDSRRASLPVLSRSRIPSGRRPSASPTSTLKPAAYIGAEISNVFLFRRLQLSAPPCRACFSHERASDKPSIPHFATRHMIGSIPSHACGCRFPDLGSPLLVGKSLLLCT